MVAAPPLRLGHQPRRDPLPTERGVDAEVIHVDAELTKALHDLEPRGLHEPQKTGLQRSNHLAVKLGDERQDIRGVVLKIASEELDEPTGFRESEPLRRQVDQLLRPLEPRTSQCLGVLGL